MSGTLNNVAPMNKVTPVDGTHSMQFSSTPSSTQPSTLCGMVKWSLFQELAVTSNTSAGTGISVLHIQTQEASPVAI